MAIMDMQASEGAAGDQAVNIIDFHCHGIGQFDFTKIHELDLYEIETILARRQQQTILTLYLPKPNFESFLNLMEIFDKGAV
jgi:hypothetical protein